MTQISSNQKLHLQSLIESGKYAEGYRYVKGIIDSARQDESDLSKAKDLAITSNWLDNAASINANDGSPKSAFVRAATKSAGEQVGKPISDAAFQKGSDDLAKDVLSDIVNKGKVPTAGEIISKDVAAAVKSLGLPYWGWGGTIGDIFPMSMGGLGRDFNHIRYQTLLQYLADLKDAIDTNIAGSAAAIPVYLRDLFLRAKNWVWPRDPIILDLDGNGLETVGLAANIHFDHDGDGVLTKTGWAGKNDALLVWDRNTNGSIDTGAELFGDFTMLPNGTLAPNGFAALAALDSNGDGVLDANDPAFAELKIWRDADQNGKTGTGELISLLDAGIVSLNLANTLKNQNLPNGNQLTREGSFTRADGSTAAMGEFQLATDTFDTKFAQEIEVPEALKSLPNMGGSGNVRQLQQAAVQSDTLASLLEQFQSATTRAEQRGLLDQLVSAWADTSGMTKTLGERVAGKYVIQYDAFGSERRSAAIDAQAMQAIQAGNTVGDTVWMTDANGMYLKSHFRTLIAEWNHKLHVLEAFNGQYFFNLPTQKSQTHGANWGLSAASSSGGGGGKTGDIARQGPPTLVVNFSQVQLDLLQQAYDSLKESVYASLVMQTRLKPYLDQIELVIDEAGIRLDASGINQMLANKKAADPEGYLADLLELDKYANQFLSDTNWSGLLDFDSFMANLEPTTGMAALLAEFKVRTLTTGDDQMSLGKDSNFVLAGDGNDRLYGNSSNDKLFGEAGNDQIFGGNGNDLISGGAGDDLLYGGAGADMYVFGRGFGHDTIVDAMAPDGLRHDMVRFIGLNSADVRVERDFDENLIFTIVDTGETLSIPGYSQYLGTSGVGRYIFDDGTVWSHEDALRATVALATDGDDVIHGSSAGDKIFGQAGHDTLVGNGGDDVFDGGADNDVLIGASAGDWVLVGDEEVYVANTMPIVWANGNDTYLFGRGDGQDTVIDGDDTAGNTDTLSFKDGVLPADVKLTRADDDLVLAIRGTNDQVTIKNYFIVGWNGSGQYLIERITFVDGTVWSFFDVQSILFAGSEEADIIVGSQGNDVLTGQAGDDVLLGGRGHDILDGGAGNDILRGGGVISPGSRQIYDWDNEGASDIYRFGRGDGHDTVIDYSWFENEIDQIAFKAGISPSDVRLERVRIISNQQISDDLKITIVDTGETLTIKNHFDASNVFAIEQMVFADGTVWGADAIKSFSLLGGDGNDDLRGFSDRDDLIAGGAGNDRLLGLFGNDTLVGGTGDDVLEGGAGSDTYRYELGSGRDVINEYDNDGNDVLEFDASISPNDVTIRWTKQGDMLVSLPRGGQVTVRGQVSRWSDLTGVEQLRFADGTTWGRAELASRALEATVGDDSIVGGYEDDTLDGGAGNDLFQNLGGYDIYNFGIGDGHDVIAATRGVLRFKPGINQNDVGFALDGEDLIVTLLASGDSIRLKSWLANWKRIDGFEFDNGAYLDENDVGAKVTVNDDSEILYGSPNADTLIGTEKNSVIYGRTGDDTLFGGEGYDTLYGEAGNDTLNGGAGRDLLVGGEGSNTYIVTHGIDLDRAWGASLEVASDTVVFGAGIRPEDVSVQLGDTSSVWDQEPGNVGYYNLVIGIGGNDALIVGQESGRDLGQGAIQHFRFEDGTHWSLADVIAHADSGKMGQQYRYSGQPTSILGSEADDEIYDYTGESVTVRAKGNDDHIRLAGGDNRVSAGSGDDRVDTGVGDDLIAGEVGEDVIRSGEGDDTVLFNYGDGNDILLVGEGTDTLSFGSNIALSMLTVVLDADQSTVLLIDGGAGGRIALGDPRSGDAPGVLERIQFIGADGAVRIFDFEAWLRANEAGLLNTTADNPLVFDGTGFEITGLAVPAGGLEAVAYAQSGDLFSTASLEHNSPTEGDDVLYGTESEDVLDAGSGNDIVMGLAGNDLILGGVGDDLIHGGHGDDALNGGVGDDVLFGGWGADTLVGGTGRDELYGEWGGDTYLYQAGDGITFIEDDHRVLEWGGGHDEARLSSSAKGLAYREEDYGGSRVDTDPNILTFGIGIRPEDLRYSEENGDLVIKFVNHPDDKVVLRGYMPDRATRTRSVDVIRFADGTEIVADSIDPTGKTEELGDEGGALEGTPLADTLIGGAGGDIIYGRGGADFLVGGAGSDTYHIYKEWGSGPTQTMIVEAWRPQDFNRIELSGQINANDLYLEFDGRDLTLRLNEEGDLIRFVGFDPRAQGMQAPVSEVSLSDEGRILSFDDLLGRGIRIIGTPNDDVLIGTALMDWIEGREANDTMSGGDGGDIYVIGADGGTDTIIDSESGNALPNVLVLPEGTTLHNLSLSYDDEGFLIIDLTNTGNRVRLSNFDPANPLGSRAVERFRFGLAGEEIGYEELLTLGFDIVGTDGNDRLKGTALTDRVWGNDGNDLIVATPGDDWLSGGAGDDIYSVQLGDGSVIIDDMSMLGEGNVLRFGSGISPNTLRNNLRFEEDGEGGYVLLIAYGSGDDVVRLIGFDPSDVLGSHAVERFEFADGTAVDYETLVSWTFVVEGDSSGNLLNGTNVADRLYGYEGEDVLEAGDGEDVLTGGAGNDILRGGAGRDAYVVNLGDGQDIIEDVLDANDIGNILTFGAGIRPEDVRVEASGNNLLIYFGQNGDSVTVSNYAPNGNGANAGTVIDTFEFANGTAVTLREFMNRAPEVFNPIGDQIVLEDSAFSLELPSDLFTDTDGSSIITQVAMADLESLPSWLQYNASTRTLYGTPTNSDVGEFDIIVQGMDSLGATAFYSFHVTIQNVNDAPQVGAAIAHQQVVEDSLFTFAVPVDAFQDMDTGDVLTFSATQADGSALPSWLHFDASSQTFSGTPDNDAVGSLAVTLVATDKAGAQSHQTFNIEITNVNDAPEIGALLSGQSASVGHLASWQVPTDTFRDIDKNDRLSYSATLADGGLLPEWLIFDAVTNSFKATPTIAGDYSVRVTATDLAGAQASQVFVLSVTADSNQAPVTVSDTAIVIEDCQPIAVGNVLANDRDLGGTPLTVVNPGIRRGEYGVLTLLPNGSYAYVLHNVSSKVQGLGAGETVTERFSYLASNGTSNNSSELVITVQGRNDAPELAHALMDVQLAKGKAFSWQMPTGTFRDIDRNDQLSYTATLADGKALPAWLKFDAATQTFSGTAPSNTPINTINVRITASDSQDECSIASDVFKISLGKKTVLPTHLDNREGSDDCSPRYSFGDGLLGNLGSLFGQSAKQLDQKLDDPQLKQFLDSFKGHNQSAAPAPVLPALNRQWMVGSSTNGQVEDEQNEEGRDGTFENGWFQLIQALNQLDSERQSMPSWKHASQGGDLAGLTHWMQGNAQTARGGTDALSLACGGTQLKVFTGAKEGLGKLLW